MHKRGITLIELMVVIIVLGIISLIALPNIKNIKSKAEISAAMENKNTVQKGVDKYFLDKQELPTTSEPEVGLPVQIDWSKLVPLYVRSKPADLDKIYYWVDYNNTVWVSDVDAPQNVLLDADEKSVSWSAVTGATEYEVGYIEETASKVNGKIMAGKSYKELQRVTGTSYSSTIDLTGKTVVVSAVSKNFESVPVGAGYTGNTLEVSPGEQPTATNHKPVAVISMSPEQGLTTATSITWDYENSTDEDGDQITNAEWDGKQDIYSTEGTYTAKLRVQDSKGNWSDWAEKSFYVINAQKVKQIATGDQYTVALMEDGTVKAWGLNNYGQLGDGTTTDKLIPTTIPGLTKVIQIAAGNLHTVALMNDGTIKTWGCNGSGQLGDGTKTNKSVPITILGLTGVKQVAAGNGHTVTLMNDGTVRAWGYNYFGQLGNGTTTNASAPTLINGLDNVKQIAAGSGHTVALMNDGTVKAWGYNYRGQLGNGTTVNATVPTLINELNNIEQISAGGNHTVALMNDGTIKTWGSNCSGQIGDGTTVDKHIPITVNGINNAKYISTGENYTLAILNDGTAKAWGQNSYGQLGNSQSVAVQSVPVTMLGITDAKQVLGGYGHTVILMNDGTLKTLGLNGNGQLGDGTTTNRLTPTTIDIH